MSNTAISQALIEIEKNLDKLSSAREQVLEVTDSGKVLASVVMDLTQKMEALYEAVLNESGTYDSAFDKSRKNFERNLEKLLDQSQKDLSRFIQNIDETEKDITKRFEIITETAASKADVLYEKQEANFKQAVQYLSEYKESITKLSENIKDFDFGSALKPIESKIDENEKTLISVVKVFKSETIQKMDQILSTVKVGIQNIEDKVEENQKEATKAHKEELLNVQNQFKEGLDRLEQKQKNYTVVTWLLIIISVIIFILI